MYTLFQLDLLPVGNVGRRTQSTTIEVYEDGELAVKDILLQWHEDDNAMLFIVYDKDGRPWATIARGLNPNDATVSRTDGASQRFRCVRKDGAFLSEVTSLD